VPKASLHSGNIAAARDRTDVRWPGDYRGIENPTTLSLDGSGDLGYPDLS
jgi:hypothetical protein